MATELEQLKKELENNDTHCKELREKLRRLDICMGMGDRSLTAIKLDQAEERKNNLLRLIKKQEDGIKHGELVAEALYLVAERTKLELELKDKCGDEKEAGKKKVAEMSAAITKALTDAEELVAEPEEQDADYCTCGDCGECGYGYYDNGHDHLARANGYNSY